MLKRALKTKCQTIQIFSRNPRGWKYKEIDNNDCLEFKKGMTDHKITPIFVHLPYLANLGSNNKELLNLSVNTLINELRRAEKLGAQFVIAHCGSNPVIEAGIMLMIKSISRAFSQVTNNVHILIENTCGSGNEFGYDFQHLSQIIDGVGSNRVGIVFDTAHAFQAGYDLRTKRAVADTIRILDKTLGIERLQLVHLNDSLTDLGSRKDRHWHIGKGKIGKGMKFIINHPGLRHVPFIMETPRKSFRDDLMNMRTVQKMKKNLDLTSKMDIIQG